MSIIAVAGLVNVETTVRVEGFPIEYSPARYPFGGVRSTVSGAGYNVAAALSALGDTVRFASIVGRDPMGALVDRALEARGIGREWVRDEAGETAQSVILYEPGGRRQVNTDLKDMQERCYPVEPFARALDGCSLAVVANVNYSRPLLRVAREAGVPIAADVHALSDLEDAYNRDYMEAADVLFMSHERLPRPPEEWARLVMDRYGPEVLVIGLGAEGALPALRRGGRAVRMPAVRTREVVSTVGAGDALLASFVHCYAATVDPDTPLGKAIVFAGHKIGSAGGAEGFLGARELDTLYARTER